MGGGSDGSVRVWEVRTAEPVGQPITGHEDWVNILAFSPDGKRVMSGSWGGSVRIWPPVRTWPDLLCAKLTHNVSREQWDEWVSPDIPDREVCPGLPVRADDADD